MRFSKLDLFWIAALLLVGGIVAIQSLPPKIVPILARQTALIDRISRERSGITLLPPPATPEEATAALAQFDRLLSYDHKAEWNKFRDFLIRRGTPTLLAEFDHRWNEYQAATEALRRFLADLADASSSTDSAAIEARRTETGVTLINRFQTAEEGLETWAARLASSDF